MFTAVRTVPCAKLGIGLFSRVSAAAELRVALTVLYVYTCWP